MARIGYARVSTVDQHLDLQRNALRAAGCDRVFEDFGISGDQDLRCGLSSLMRTLRRGDILVVWRLDRLSRSISHLLAVIEKLSRRGVEFLSLTESIDTSSAGGRLIFHLMAALAEFEKALIRERTIAGLQAAKARGRFPGRRRVLTDAQCMEIRSSLRNGTSLKEAARITSIRGPSPEASNAWVRPRRRDLPEKGHDA